MQLSFYSPTRQPWDWQVCCGAIHPLLIAKILHRPLNFCAQNANSHGTDVVATGDMLCCPQGVDVINFGIRQYEIASEPEKFPIFKNSYHH